MYNYDVPFIVQLQLHGLEIKFGDPLVIVATRTRQSSFVNAHIPYFMVDSSQVLSRALCSLFARTCSLVWMVAMAFSYSFYIQGIERLRQGSRESKHTFDALLWAHTLVLDLPPCPHNYYKGKQANKILCVSLTLQLLSGHIFTFILARILPLAGSLSTTSSNKME